MTHGGDRAYGATIAKRRLAAILTDLRLDRGLTAMQVCASLGWGRGKLGRFEMNQWKRPEMSDIRDLLRFYQVDSGEQVRIVELAALSRQRPWWRGYSDIFDTEYPGYENDARQIIVFLPLAVPPLLQTPTYARTHAEQIHCSAALHGRFLETILCRQRILLREDGTAPALIAVITEAALRYAWGSSTDRREQAGHLVSLGRRPNIELRLYPFEAGPHPEPLGAVCQLRFGQQDPDLFFLDSGLATRVISNPAQAHAHVVQLARALDRAWDRATTLTYLAGLAASLG